MKENQCKGKGSCNSCGEKKCGSKHNCHSANVIRHGEWIWQFNLDGDDFFECSICGRQEVINELCRDKNPTEHYPFCHCGAKMDAERKSK